MLLFQNIVFGYYKELKRVQFQLHNTDKTIDAIIYVLDGMCDEEIAEVDGRG